MFFLLFASQFTTKEQENMSNCSPNQVDETTSNIASDRAKHLRKAVYQHKASSRAGLSERLFTWMFKGLVYPQI